MSDGESDKENVCPFVWKIDNRGCLYTGERKEEENVSPAKRKTPEHTPIKKRRKHEC